MKTTLVLFVLASTLLAACGSSPSQPTPTGRALPSIHATLDDSPNCTTELQASSDLCDDQHLLVLTCADPEACPDYRRCVQDSAGMPRGLVWCCSP